MRRHTVLALVISGIGIAGLLFVLLGSTSVRQYVADTYTFVGEEPIPGDEDRSLVYASTDTVSRTAERIAAEHAPADRRVTEAGVFLRYREDFVSVVGRDEGTRILVDDEDSGYRHGFLYLGGWWGTYSGRGESFRGGGPGAGK